MDVMDMDIMDNDMSVRSGTFSSSFFSEREVFSSYTKAFKSSETVLIPLNVRDLTGVCHDQIWNR